MPNSLAGLSNSAFDFLVADVMPTEQDYATYSDLQLIPVIATAIVLFYNVPIDSGVDVQFVCLYLCVCPCVACVRLCF